MRRGALAAASVAVLALGALGTAGAHAEAAAPLGGYSLIGRAPGFEITEDEPSAQTHPEGQGTIPETVSQLTTGTAYAFSSVVWPGTIGGNAGSLVLGTVGGNTPLPPQVSLLNDPVRAEARTGQTQPDVVYSTPAETMKAHADVSRAEASSSSQGTTVPGALSTGRVTSDTTSTLDAAGGTVVATSTVSNVELAGGTIHIGSVTSKASASTNGGSSQGGGGTTVADLRIAGQPATIDDHGLRVGSSSQPANEIVNQIVNSAVGKLGVTFALSKPTVQSSGALTTTTAGSLIVVWKPPGSQNVFAVTFGGASATVNGAPAFNGPDSSSPAVAGSGPAPGGAADVIPPSSPPSAETGPAGSPALPPTVSSRRAAPPLPARLAAIALPGGLPVPWLLLALGAAGLLASGMARLGPGLLADGARCGLELEEGL